MYGLAGAVAPEAPAAKEHPPPPRPRPDPATSPTTPPILPTRANPGLPQEPDFNTAAAWPTNELSPTNTTTPNSTNDERRPFRTHPPYRPSTQCERTRS